MAVGQVSFHSDKKVGYTYIYSRFEIHILVHRSREVNRAAASCHCDHLTTTTVHVDKRENAIVNRLNKTKVERIVDHEQEKIERLKQENAASRAAAAAKVCSKQLKRHQS